MAEDASALSLQHMAGSRGKQTWSQGGWLPSQQRFLQACRPHARIAVHRLSHLQCHAPSKVQASSTLGNTSVTRSTGVLSRRMARAECCLPKVIS